MTVSVSPQRDCVRRASLAVAPTWPSEMRRRAGQRQSREPQIKGSSAGGREFEASFFSTGTGQTVNSFSGTYCDTSILAYAM